MFYIYLKKTLNNDFLFLFHLFNSKVTVTKYKSEVMKNSNKKSSSLHYLEIFMLA